MEDPSNRRRRPVTYGKSTRNKRPSDISEIFSTPGASSPRPQQEGARLPLPLTTDEEANLRQKLQFAAKNKKRPTPKVSKQKLSTAARTAPKASPVSATTTSDEDASGGPADEAAATQLKNEDLLSRGGDFGVFEFPSSDSDESATRSLKRKRVPQNTASKLKGKPPVDKPEAKPMVTKSKRSRVAARTKSEEPVTGPLKPNKLTSAAKITKPANRSISQKGIEGVPVQMAFEHLSPESDTAPNRTRATHSRSRQLSVEPVTVKIQPTSFKKSQPRIAQKNIEEVVEEITRHKETGNLVVSHKPVVDNPPKPLREKNLKVASKKSPPVKVIAEKVIKNIYKTAKTIQPKAASPADNAHSAPATSPITNPRKRLIDALGVGPSGPRKKSCSPTRSEGSDIFDSDIFGNLESSQDFGSQSQSIPGSEETASQEVTITAIQRQMPSGRAVPRITYARDRSFRAEEISGSLEDLFNMPLPKIQPKQLGRRRLEQPQPDRDGDIKEPEKSKHVIKSIHELRAAGEHNRFIDDVEDLFLDIEGACAIGTKRSGYFELTRKLSDKTFNHKFRTNSFDERLLTNMDQQEDEIICFTLSYLTLCFLVDDSTPRTMFQVFNNGIMPMLSRMFDSSRDILAVAKDKKINMSKVALAQVADLRALVEKSAAFSSIENKVLSPRIISLKVLDLLVSQFRAHGSTDELLPRGVLRGLVEILDPFVSSKEYPKSLKTRGIQLLELPVSILEAYTMGGSGNLAAQITKDQLVTVANLFPVITGWNCDEDLGPVQLLLLRLNINLTNNHPIVCETLAESSLIGSLVGNIKKNFENLSGVLEERERLFSVDLLVLSLGLMMNFAEFSPKARAVVGNEVVSTVEGSPRGIDILLDIFLDRLEHTAEANSMEESHTNVAFGYLAVLLGDLCQEDHIRYKARGRLPNSSLKSLLGAVEEFVAHHRKVDEHMFGMEAGEEQQENNPGEFTGRLQDVMVRLRAYA